MSDTFALAPTVQNEGISIGESRLRVAVVGTGTWWGRQHLRAFAERPDVEIVAVVGRSPEKTRARADIVGARAYTDPVAMVEHEHPDLASVCLSNQGHFETTLALIKTGTPLLVEKPFVFDLAEADELLGEADSRDLFLAIDFNHRTATPVQMARETIASGRLGEIVYATWRFGGEGSSPHPDANLIETQCHGFDMLEYLCGPIRSVAAEMTEFEGRGHSTVAIALRFANDAAGTLLGSYDSSYAYPDTHRLEIGGTLGRIVVRDTVRSFEFQATGNELREVWEAGYFNDLGRMFHRTLDRHLDAVLAALRAGGPPPVHARAGRRALELAYASIESFQSGRRITLS
ncbi:MAG: Gfo/Idh/MocA family oxidoreductase [Chloroflexota bacterium]|nr:Gfo/Idh/MocA family oxidoreductase [Chloroflexota bacterium]